MIGFLATTIIIHFVCLLGGCSCSCIVFIYLYLVINAIIKCFKESRRFFINKKALIRKTEKKILTLEEQLYV